MTQETPNGRGAEGSTGGRPPVTSHAELALVALDLFERQGFEETSVDDVATAAGIGRRTFFRYFPTKSAVLWHEVDEEIAQLRRALAAADPGVPMMRCIRDAVVAINGARTDLRMLRLRTDVIRRLPGLQGPAVVHGSGWAQVVADFVARRTGEPADALIPSTVGRAALACATAAYEAWRARPSASLVDCLDVALTALANGFDEDLLTRPARPGPRTTSR